jgi:hypothetical protein
MLSQYDFMGRHSRSSYIRYNPNQFSRNFLGEVGCKIQSIYHMTMAYQVDFPIDLSYSQVGVPTIPILLYSQISRRMENTVVSIKCMM